MERGEENEECYVVDFVRGRIEWNVDGIKAERRVCVSQDLARTDLAAFFSIARPIDNKFAADGA